VQIAARNERGHIAVTSPGSAPDALLELIRSDDGKTDTLAEKDADGTWHVEGYRLIRAGAVRDGDLWTIPDGAVNIRPAGYQPPNGCSWEH
jgi:hypothetical protein